MGLSLRDFLSIRWHDDGRPLIQPPWPSPIVADPSFLFPEECPDGLWALACHDAFGLLLYRSADGLNWGRPRRIAFNAMRPFLRKVGDSYLLWHEAYRPLGLPLSILPRPPRWRSRIALMESRDLSVWSAGRILLEASPAWAREGERGESLSNPCVVENDAGGWSLYCSAGLALIPDCGFNEPRHLALALGPGPRGPFRIREAPLPYPGSDSALGAGSIKVLRREGGWIGLQNLIAAGADGRSRSFIRLLSSEDGLAWSLAREEPLLSPSEGWRSSHVYACDARFREADGLWYLYYNARDGWYKTEGRERIGCLVGEPA
jgi:hypothetical protein